MPGKKPRTKDVRLVGNIFGEMLVEKLDTEGDELADYLATRIDGSGERVTSGKLVLTQAEMAEAVKKVLSYVKIAAPAIIKKALSEFSEES